MLYMLGEHRSFLYPENTGVQVFKYSGIQVLGIRHPTLYTLHFYTLQGYPGAASLDSPAFAMMITDILLRLGAVGRLQRLGVELQSFAHTQRHIAQQDRFGHRPGVAEVASGGS